MIFERPVMRGTFVNLLGVATQQSNFPSVRCRLGTTVARDAHRLYFGSSALAMGATRMYGVSPGVLSNDDGVPSMYDLQASYLCGDNISAFLALGYAPAVTNAATGIEIASMTIVDAVAGKAGSMSGRLLETGGSLSFVPMLVIHSDLALANVDIIATMSAQRLVKGVQYENPRQ